MEGISAAVGSRYSASVMVQERLGIAIVTHPLEQCISDPVNNAAMNLTFGSLRIDRLSTVIDDNVV